MKKLNIFYAAAAGFLIGLGVIVNTLVAQPILGACLFSFGLLTIIDLQLPLYTGQIGFIEKHNKINLIKILIFNLIGIGIGVALWSIKDPIFTQTLIEKSISKFNKGYLQIFIDGFFCGTLIHFAVKSKKMLITSIAVIIFILIGAEHCIADFPYFMVNLSLSNFLKFFLIILGNSCGAIFIENMLKKEDN